jgi:hypothetical protein
VFLLFFRGVLRRHAAVVRLHFRSYLRILLMAGGVVVLCVIAVLVAVKSSRRPPELPGEELSPVDPASTACSSR